jgi:hypothetical protein
MQKITDADVEQIVSTAKEQGLPVGDVVCDSTSVTMRVTDRAAVQAWADHLESGVVERPGAVETGYTEFGYTFRVVTPV